VSSDVCLVLEGTWPLRTGGVATWVDSLVHGLPDISFSVAHLTDGRRVPPRYNIPANVFDVVYIDVSGDGPLPDRRLSERLPEARVIHALSSGESGWLATDAARSRGIPLILTEHGLAWREAAASCGELESGRRVPMTGAVEWVEPLLRSAQDAYTRADVITTVCRDNARLQRAAGAPAERIRVIENFVEPAEVRPASDATSGLHIGMVCRVVGLKDVETFVEAAALVTAVDPRTRFTVVGPLTHAPDYVARVRRLVADRGLSRSFVLTGEADPSQWLPQFDVVALSSTSEAQPLALLEAMARGIPVVATKVGGCADLVGGEPASGLVVPPQDPRAFADALLELAADPAARAWLGRNGRSVTQSWHSPERVLGCYRDVYRELLQATSPQRSRALTAAGV
jgi:glycosyltransferase involved in cell wall biosynthesis